MSKLDEARSSLLRAAGWDAEDPSISPVIIKGLCEAATAYADERRKAARPQADGVGGPTVFPNYGRSKGAPIAGATLQDLEFYVRGCQRTLDDESKSRWHEKERALLAVLEAEISRQS